MKLIIALNLVSTAAAFGALRSNAFLSSGMQPDRVAQIFLGVLDDWKAQVHTCVESEKGVCKQAKSAFGKSCGKVAQSVVQGSLGNIHDVREYLDDVCNQQAMFGWHQTRCRALNQAITGKMTADVNQNRNGFPASDACWSLWVNFLKEQTQVHDKEVLEQKAQAQKEEEAAAEEAKKAAAKAEAEKKAEAEAEKQMKAKEEADAEAEKKRSADAKAEVAKLMDQERAKIKKVESKADEELKEATELEGDAVAKKTEVMPPPAPHAATTSEVVKEKPATKLEKDSIAAVVAAPVTKPLEKESNKVVAHLPPRPASKIVPPPLP